MSSFREVKPADGSGLSSKLPVERVVALLTPVFGAVSAWLVGWVGTHFPGLHAITPDDVTALQIAGFTGAVAAALKWLHGRQKFVGFTGDIEKVVNAVVKSVGVSSAGPALGDIEYIVREHASDIVSAISKDLHVPPSAEEIAQAVVKGLVGGSVGGSTPAASAAAPAQAPAPAAVVGAASVQ